MKFGDFNPSEGFEAVAREFWSKWGDFARQSGGAQSAAPGWQQAVDWWSQLAHGGREEANAAVEQFNKQGAHWFGLMQSVAAQFAGQNGSAADVARAWQKAVGAQGENPFPEMFRGLRGHGVAGLERWVEDASPFLDAWRKEAASLLSLPAFGLAREHQERWQAMQRAQMALRQSQSAYQALLGKVGQRAFEVFEGKLEAQSEPGRGLETARALFDLWIDAAEEAYAEIALSPDFRRVYGQMVNDQMRLRKAVQDEVERFGAMLGLPGRSEVDASHRKLHAVEKELRALKAQVAALVASGAAPGKGSAARPAAAAPRHAASSQATGAPAAKATAKPKASAKPKPKPKASASQASPAKTASSPAPSKAKAAAARKSAASKAKAGSKAKSKVDKKSKVDTKTKPGKKSKAAKPMLSLSRMPVRPGSESASDRKASKASKRGSAK